MTDEISKDANKSIPSPPVTPPEDEHPDEQNQSGYISGFLRRNKAVPEYGTIYFDHLYSEYKLIRHELNDEEKKICQVTLEKRESGEMIWNDIYTFQRVLLAHYKFETLLSRIISLRIKFQNLADANEYADYLTYRAVDLTKLTGSAPDTTKPSLAKPDSEIIKKLRADLEYLLNEFYMRYAFITAREKLRNKLLRRGTISTLAFFFVAVGFVVLHFTSQDANYQGYITPFATLISVSFAGIMGGFVSTQQRLQTTQSKGDPIYNLSLLTHGWLSIVLSPISGSIFAVLLYFFFAGKLLEGTIFPQMTEAPIRSFTDAAGLEHTFMNLQAFVLGTHPATGKAYALVLIWSFVAGFAERFVPDTLMRLVNTKKESNTPAA